MGCDGSKGTAARTNNKKRPTGRGGNQNADLMEAVMDEDNQEMAGQALEAISGWLGGGEAEEGAEEGEAAEEAQEEEAPYGEEEE